MRHGKTDRNKANVLQGRSDDPLNAEGIEQAKEAAAKLRSIHFDHVFCSPLIRAVETAELVAPDVKPVIDERLIEMDYGPWEGADLVHPAPELLSFFSDFVSRPAPPGMESLASVTERAADFIRDIQDAPGTF